MRLKLVMFSARHLNQPRFIYTLQIVLQLTSNMIPSELLSIILRKWLDYRPSNIIALQSALLILMIMGTAVDCGSNPEYLADINNEKLDLQSNKIYYIHNRATNLPLLHDRPGSNITRLSHWWMFHPIQDNIYYLQIQDERVNNSAPRWDRTVRLSRSSTQGYYHLHPINCFKYTKIDNFGSMDLNSNYFYFDYFDENGGDNSECVGGMGMNWLDGLSNKPGEVISMKNFDYGITPFESELEKYLRQSQDKAVVFRKILNKTKKPTFNFLPLPEMGLKIIQNEDSHELAGVISYGSAFDCSCKKPIITNITSYFSFVLKKSFRLNIFEKQFENDVALIHLNITGGLGKKIKKLNILLSRPTVTLYMTKEILLANFMGGINFWRLLNNQNSQTEWDRSYLSFDPSFDEFKFKFDSQIFPNYTSPSTDSDTGSCSCIPAPQWKSFRICWYYGAFAVMIILCIVYNMLLKGINKLGPTGKIHHGYDNNLKEMFKSSLQGMDNEKDELKTGLCPRKESFDT